MVRTIYAQNVQYFRTEKARIKMFAKEKKKIFNISPIKLLLTKNIWSQFMLATAHFPFALLSNVNIHALQADAADFRFKHFRVNNFFCNECIFDE